MNGKKLYLSLSSPQEYSACKFCDSDWVTRKIELWIHNCNHSDCLLLIMPFQIHFNRDTGKMNANCIKKPIVELKRKFKVYVVYLRKNGSRNIAPRVDKDRLKRIDDLMRHLQNHEIESSKGAKKKQADDLWNFIMKVDP
jgi:hypothetical protein